MDKYLAVIFAVAFAASSSNALARVTGDPLQIEGGKVEGQWAQNTEVKAYLGIPYAAPPVGELRWAEPGPVVPWSGVRKADKQPAMCMQTLRTPGTISIEVYGNQNLPMSEDCLHLNVWAPADASSSSKLPVFVWIHGGAFTSGSAAKPEFNGERLAKRGIIVVSINYRLNIFGYFAHPDLTAQSPNHSSGNYGALDQVAALKWVEKNISSFGGDPSKVTIGGQSAGSTSVNNLMASPLARGLIDGALAQSGGVAATQTKTLKAAEDEGRKFTDMLGDQSIKDLRAMPAEVVLSLWSDTKTRFAGPVVDGYFLKRSVGDVWAAGEQAKVPYLVGWSRDEFYENIYNRTEDEFVKQAAKEVGQERVAEMRTLYGVKDNATATAARVGFSRDANFGLNTWNAASSQAKGKSPTYLYYWTRLSPFWEGQSFQENSPASLLGAYHGSQVPYVFGTLDVLDREFTARDRELSSLWQAYIANFVETGNPNGTGLPEWPTFDNTAEKVLEIGDKTTVVDLPNKPQMNFFRKMVKK